MDSTIKYVLYLPIGEARGSADAKIKEIPIMERLLELSKKQGYSFIIKIKAGLNADHYNHLIQNGAILISEKIPAEIVISEIHNSIIVSAFSSSALHNINNNRYYWIFPILQFKTNLKPPTKNIQIIEQVSVLDNIF